MQIHYREKEQFKKLFLQENIDRFEDRFRILEVFLQHERHMTLEGLSDFLRQSGTPFDLDFIHDTLRLMCHYGFAVKNNFDNGHAWYEHQHLGRHHDHMICIKCRKILEFEDAELENRQVHVTTEKGFHMLQHRMEIYGICQECLKERRGHLSLATAKAGETLRVKAFEGGAKMRLRLLSMGIRIGDTLKVITNQGTGQVVVAIECSRFALGRGLAERVLVEFEDPKQALLAAPECTLDDTTEKKNG